MDNGGVERRYDGKLYAEQVALLYKNARLAYPITLINGAILVIVQGPHVAPVVLFAWYGVLLSVTGLRTLIVRRYINANPGPDAAQRWNSIYVAGTALAGSVWGAAAFVMLPNASPAHEVFVAFVLAGMSAGSITVLAFRMEACLAFLFPALLPLLLRYLTLGTTLHLAMSVMASIFLVGMVITAASFNRAVRTSMILRFDKRELEQEISRRNRAEQALLLEKDRLQTVLSSIGEGVALIDANGCIEYLNFVAEKICLCTSDRAVGRPASAVFQTFDRHRHQRTSTAMEDALRMGRQITKQTVMGDDSGNRCVIEELATPLYDHQRRIVGAVSILRDVTEKLQQTEQLVHAARHDALTGLPNRSLLQSRMQRAIARAQRRRECFALLFLDLDRFKEVNDTMGHAAGDALLVEVARRLTDAVREEDTVARLGGDEFVVLLEGPTQDEHVKSIAEKIHQTVCEPFQLGTQSATVSVSIGTSLYPDDGEDPDTLLMHADAAMYGAKNR